MIVLQVSAHTSAMVRSAAAATLTGLLEPTYEILSPDIRAQIWKWAHDAALKDDVTSVRAAGAKALGVLVGFSALILEQGVSAFNVIRILVDTRTPCPVTKHQSP